MDSKELVSWIKELIEGNNLKKFYNSKTIWRPVRSEALKRDNYECQECKKLGKYSEATTVHHIKHLKEYPELSEVYLAKDLFCNKMLKLHEREETENSIDFFINNFSKSTSIELNNIAKTFSNWKEEIINAYSKNSFGIVLTNAIAESNNNYIQKMINIGYGYSNFPRLRKRILYMSSNRKRGSD